MQKNYLTYSLLILFLTISFAVIISKGIAYFVPSRQQFKTFNPISDFKISDAQPSVIEEMTPSSVLLPNISDSLNTSDLPNDTIVAADSIEKISFPDISSVSEIGEGLSDFSGSKKWIEKIRNKIAHAREEKMVIAFIGDSFIEGDIFVAPFRDKLQQNHGGCGVGLVPITSVVNRFRVTVKHDYSGGWKQYSATHHHKNGYTLSEKYDVPMSAASVTYKTVKNPYNLSHAEEVNVLYSSLNSTSIRYKINDGEKIDTVLSATGGTVSIFRPNILDNEVRHFEMNVSPSDDTQFHGVALDGRSGINVDNLSLRGASGISLGGILSSLSTSLQEKRPYDLLILTFGLNVINPKQPNDTYHWYLRSMEKSITHLKEIYPDVPILILSVSDRCSRKDNELTTLPGVFNLMLVQYNLARRQGCLFWNTYAAMQELGGMPELVRKGFAAKDYTHIGAKAGILLADLLYRDLMGEESKLKTEAEQRTEKADTMMTAEEEL